MPDIDVKPGDWVRFRWMSGVDLIAKVATVGAETIKIERASFWGTYESATVHRTDIIEVRREDHA